MKSNYAVTFEFMTRQPLTYKGECEATSIRTLAARAIDLAIDQNVLTKESNRQWSSICIVLDRYDFIGSESKDDFENEI